MTGESCDRTCDRPSALKDCNATLSPSDLSTVLGMPVKTVDDDHGSGDSCSRHFVVGERGIFQLNFFELRTKAAARESVMSAMDKMVDEEEPVARLGDAARRWRAPFESDAGCHLRFAKQRVSVHIMLSQATCDWDALVKVAQKVAAGLP